MILKLAEAAPLALDANASLIYAHTIDPLKRVVIRRIA
jgi:hypothetical protein